MIDQGLTNVPPSTGGRPERRRPGRKENVAPELIPLLRAHEGPLVEDGYRGRAGVNRLQPLRGIAVAVLISAVLWWVVGKLI